MTLPAASDRRPGERAKEPALQRHDAMDRFLAEVQRRALRIAELGVGNRDDALDIVQDAMLRLAQHYAHKDPAEWRPLFYRILKNRVRDHHRRGSLGRRIFAWLPRRADAPDPVATAPDPVTPQPDRALAAGDAMQALEGAVAALPGRQREAFLLRTLEGMDTRETARAMGCSEGSVKTHYSRALAALRASLGDHWP